jgi:hypothetical protein
MDRSEIERAATFNERRGMNSITASQILQAMKNERRAPRTRGAKIKAALEHARTSPLRKMIELERKRRARQMREGSEGTPHPHRFTPATRRNNSDLRLRPQG